MPGHVLAVSVVHAALPSPARGAGPQQTSIDKRPVDGPVAVHRLGLEGDTQSDRRYHGGPDQAVYAYAQEDAVWWEAELGRELPPGRFGDNLRTSGVDVTGAVIGEHWRIGSTVLVVRVPRMPCTKLQRFWGVPGLVRRFTEHGVPGAYLGVLAEGEVVAGDTIEVEHRPEHGVSIGDAFAALTTRPERADHVLIAGADLPGELWRSMHRVRGRAAV